MMRVINKKSEVEKNQLNNTKTNKKNSNSKELRSNINVTSLLTESKIL